MLVQDMVNLTDIWRVIADDPGTPHMALTLDPLSAAFVGTHSEAQAGEPGDQRILVGGERLRGVLGLFDPEAELEVVYTPEDNALKFKTSGRVATLQTVVTSEHSGLGYEDERRSLTVPKQQKVAITPFVKALQFLQTCVGTQPSEPLLTGVKVAHDKDGGLILVGTDRDAHTGLVRVAGKKPNSRINGEVVFHTKEVIEFLAFAEGMGDTDVVVKLTSDKCAFSSGGAVMQMASLHGAKPFPDVSQLPTVRRFKRAVSINPQDIVSATKASVLLDADRVVKLAIKSGRAALIVRGVETGSFRTLVAADEVGNRNMEDMELEFDAHWLAPLEHMGTKATLYYESPRVPALFVGDNGYRLWMALISRN